MSIITILLFFIYTWGLGTALTLFTKNSDNFLERNIMRAGIGLGIFVVLSVLLNFLHIPLDWKIFLTLSLLGPSYLAYKQYKTKKFSFPKLTTSNLYIFLVFILFFFTLNMYHTGAFAYPYLEDGDPWGHAIAIKYISLEKTAFEPFPGINTFQYIDAYPPGYDILLAILHQTSHYISWTLKFFNSLIISLGIIFFYFFAKELMNNKSKALFATFALAMVPSYLSHFIWAHSLIITLIFPLFYCIRKIKLDKKWIYPSMIIFGSLALIQMTQFVKIFILTLIYLFVISLKEKKLNKQICLIIIGGLLIGALIWWIPMALKYKGDLLTVGLTQGTKSFLGPRWKDYGIKYIGPLGTATRIYTFKDFFIAQHQNMINNPVGVGIVLSSLLLLSLIPLALNWKKLLKDRNDWKLITLLWLLFAFLGIHGGTRIPVALFSFRFWALFAIFLSLIVTEGLWFLFGLVGKNKILRLIIVIIIITGVWYTSGTQKYSVNTATWPPGGGWGSNQDIKGYAWMKQNLPLNTRVAPMLDAGHLVGMDLFNCVWCKEEKEIYEGSINKSAEEIYNILKKHNYAYAVFDTNYLQKYGFNETEAKINSLLTSNNFHVAYQDTGFIVLGVR